MLVAAATLPAFAVLVLLTRELGREQYARERADALAHAQLVDADVLSLVAAARQLAVSIGATRSVATHDPACRQQLLTLQRSLGEYTFLAVLDEDLQLVCSTEATPVATPALLHIARRVLAAQGFAVDHYDRDDTGAPYLGFGLPVRSAGGAVTGLVLGGIGLDWLGRHLIELGGAVGASVTLLDRDSVALAHAPDGARWIGRTMPELTRRLDLAGAATPGAATPGAATPGAAPAGAAPLGATMAGAPEPGTATPGAAPLETRNGTTRMFGYVPAAANPQGLAVVVSLPSEGGLGFAPALRHSWVALMVFAALSLLAALVLGERYISRPTAALLDAARRWSSGDLGARAALDEAPRTEFGSLARAFNTMAEGLGRQRAELERLNASLESRVAERTLALSASHNRLQVEIAERELSEAQLRQAQKLQAVGELAGGLAHDFNNLLTTVLGSLELLQRQVAASEERSRRLITAAMSAVERGGRLTAQLIAFSRKQRLLPLPSDLNAALGGMRGLIASTLGPGVRLELRLEPGLFAVLVDPNQLEAAILNLVLNARDAMDGLGGASGTLLLTTTRRAVAPDGALGAEPLAARLAASGGAAADPGPAEPDHGWAGSAPAGTATEESALAPGEYAVLTVEDTGCGMPPEVVSRVFEPFFTTKGPGRGSGLGLSQVHGLAHQSGGAVQVFSRPRQGTRVTLVLPRAVLAQAVPLHALPSALPGQSAAAHPVLATLGRSGARVPARDATLLLVDDEADVREVTAETLTDAGYHVLVAADGQHALELLRGHAVDLLLADYAMPGMNGIELIREARARQAGLQVLLVTGYAELGGVPDMDGLLAHQVVRKPFRAAELLRRVEAMLGRVPEAA